MKINQSLQQKLLQKLSPQQIQLMKLLQVPLVELEQRIKDEIEENPALEEGRESLMENDEITAEMDGDYGTDSRDDFNIEDYMNDDDPSYKTYSNNYSPDDDEKAIPLSGGKTFQENLIDQIRLRIQGDKEMIIAETIIGNLDEIGYLRREIPNMVDDLAFRQNIMVTEEEIEQILYKVQDLDPPGIAARDLQECLMIQIQKKMSLDIPTEELIDAERILENCFIEFTKKHYSKIVKKLEITEEELKGAVEEITKLNPKPAGGIKESGVPNEQIIPDFLLREEDGELILSLNARNAPELKVSSSYQNMLQSYSEGNKSKENKEAVLFIKQKLDGAKWFIDAIKQRQNTMMVTMQAILDYQKEYFLTGDETKIKPMILKDIADRIGLDISTVSRVANSKYIQTPFGTFLLKSFFSESITTESGEDVSTREVKKILQTIIDGEDKKKPLTDDAIAAELKEKGYSIARRTVAKYREQLDIPVARLRKEL